MKLGFKQAERFAAPQRSSKRLAPRQNFLLAACFHLLECMMKWRRIVGASCGIS
jgi:hypothetical protein